MATFNYKNEYERYKRYFLSLDPLMNKPTNRAYTTVIFSFLAVSLFGWYAIRPTMQTIFTLKREISDKTIVGKQMEDKISALIEAQANYQDVQDQLPYLDQALPIDPEPIEGVAEFRGLASDSGVAITSFSLPPVTLSSGSGVPTISSANKILSIPVSLTITGVYGNIKSFLLGLNNLRRITQITGMSFTLKQGSSPVASPSAVQEAPGTNLQVDLKLNVFYETR